MIALALVAGAVVMRRHALPSDGLYHDDAWAAISITLTSPREWLYTSVEHPGFVALLSPLRYVGQHNPDVLVIPVLVIGALAPVVVYALLRSLSYARSIATALAAVLVVAPGPVALSGHLKTYQIDLIVVAAVAMILPRLVRTRWSSRMAALWVVATVLLGTLSGYALLITAIAGVVLVWYAAGDRRTRVVAVALQLLVQLAYFRFISTTYAAASLRRWWQHQNGFIDLDPNPAVTAGNLLLHFRRMLAVFPGGGPALTTVMVIVVIVGLVFAARSHSAIAARFLVLLLLVAVVAGTVQLLPFGPGPGWWLGRLSLWLVPVTAVGIAELAHRARSRGGPKLRAVFDAAAYTFVVVLVVVSVTHVPRYWFTGSHSAVAFIDANLGRDDILILNKYSSYAYANETDSRVNVRHDARTQTGTRLDLDHRVVPVERPALVRRLPARLPRTRLVIVFNGTPWHFVSNDAADRELRVAGFRPAYYLTFGGTRVVLWGR
jgi:hypothetical protein